MSFKGRRCSSQTFGVTERLLLVVLLLLLALLLALLLRLSAPFLPTGKLGWLCILAVVAGDGGFCGCGCTGGGCSCGGGFKWAGG